MLIRVALGALLMFCLPVHAAAPAPATRPVVALTADEHWLDTKDKEKRPGPILVRELLRQSLLIAARDELGLATRDQALREPVIAPGVVKLQVSTSGYAPLKVKVARDDAVIYDAILDAKPHYTYDDVAGIAVAAEKYSRKQYVDLLKKAGLSGTRNALKADAPPPPDAAKYLERLDFLCQFAAARATHDAIRADGESPARLGVLVRAYANLGQLTAFHWTSWHKTFKARSLLYAQRMVAADPKSSVALWHRAYARAMCGLHAAALDDLAAAGALKTDVARPGWLKVVDPLCRYQAGELMELSTRDDGVAPLAMFCAFLTVEHSRSQGAEMTFAQAAAQLNPTCLRLIDYMCAHTGPGMLNELTERGPQTLSDMLGKDLEKLPGFPKQISEQIAALRRPGGNPGGRAVVVKSLLMQKDDRGEPSWPALGRLIEEVTFVQTYRRADLIYNGWGVDASDYVVAMAPFLGEHPYRAYMNRYAEHHMPAERRREILKDIKPVDLDIQCYPLVNAMAAAGIKSDERKRGWYLSGYDHADAIATDQERILRAYFRNAPSAYKKARLAALEKVSPHCPMAMVMRIRDDWPAAQPQVEKWLAEHGRHPALSFQLAIRYRELKQYDESEKHWKNYIAVAQDRAGYEQLASLYKAQGKMDQWLATKLEFLKQPDYGLQHAVTRVAIADYYMSRGEFAKAVKFAEEAAATGAGWAILCAADARMYVGDWERAEAWVVENAQHYDSPLSYFRWCVRTGHGRSDLALRMVDAQLSTMGEKDPMTLRWQQAQRHLLAGERKTAVPPLQWLLEQDRLMSGMHLALIHHVTGDKAARDKTLAAIAVFGVDEKKWTGLANRTVEVATLLQTALAQPAPKLDDAAIEKRLATLYSDDREELDYIVGRWLEIFEQKDAALRHFKRCASTSESNRTEVALAWEILRKNNIDPLKLPRNLPEPATTQPIGEVDDDPAKPE